MAILKYLFIMDDKNIETYTIVENNYELVKYKGEKSCKLKSIKEYFKWFETVASIATDDIVDYCFLSQKPLENLDIGNDDCQISSWDKDQIIKFLKEKRKYENYKIIYGDEDDYFIYQGKNQNDDKKEKSIYLKCIPKFHPKKTEKKDNKSGDGYLYRYFKEKLNKI